MPAVPEDIIQEVEKGRKEVAAGEGKAVDFSFYLLLDRIEGLRQEMKQEINGLRQEISGVRQEMKQDVNSLRQEMKQDINSLRQEMKQEISGLRQEMNVLRQELKEDIRHIDAKLNNVIWAAIGTFFAVLVGAAGVVVAIYYTLGK
ncbi:MAG: coiled-coil domain-containing protein [Moorellaceae bacterium]